MGELGRSFGRAAELLLQRDADVMSAVGLTFETALCATFVASLGAVPVGLALGSFSFRGRDTLQAVLQALLAVPTVVIGLGLYLLLSRRGPLGSFDLLYTPAAIVIGQTLLAFPVIAAFVAAASSAADPRALETARALGAGWTRALASLAGELRLPLLAAIAAGYGRVISEIGVAMIVGGNIRGSTRTMTTTIALETAKGDFALAIALGLLLLLASVVLNLVALRARR